MLREDAVPLEVFHERDLVGYGQSTSHPHRPRRLALGIWPYGARIPLEQ